jgi:hypothetical protein
MSKLLRVNLSDSKTNIEELPKEYLRIRGKGFNFWNNKQGGSSPSGSTWR